MSTPFVLCFKWSCRIFCSNFVKGTNDKECVDFIFLFLWFRLESSRRLRVRQRVYRHHPLFPTLLPNSSCLLGEKHKRRFREKHKGQRERRRYHLSFLLLLPNPSWRLREGTESVSTSPQVVNRLLVLNHRATCQSICHRGDHPVSPR